MNKTLKVLGRMALTVALALVPALFTAPRAYAASNSQDVQSAWFGQQAIGGIRIGGGGSVTNLTQAASTSSVIMNLTYSGTNSAAYVAFTASSITFYSPLGTADTGVGSATYGASGGTFDLTVSTLATLGQVCDAINKVGGPFTLSGAANGGAPTGGNYHCTLVDGVRNDPVAYLPSAIGAASGLDSLNAVGGYNVPFGTNTVVSLGIIPAAGKHVVLNYCSVNMQENGTSATPVQVFGALAKFGVGSGGQDLGTFGSPKTDSDIIWSGAALSANSTTNIPLATPIALPWLEFAGRGSDSYALNVPAGHVPNPPVGNNYNGHVVVRVNNYTVSSTSATAANFLNCNWSERSN